MIDGRAGARYAGWPRFDFVRSNPATERQWQAYGPAGQAQLLAGIHLRRLGTPEDIAHAVAFLASEQAGWISGQILSVDGGRS